MNTTVSSKLSSEAKRALWAGLLFSVVFTALIGVLGQRIDHSGFLPDQGPSWYFWKLPNPTFWTRFTAWSFYLAHQVTVWGLIYYAQTRVKKYTSGVHKLNWIALGANAFFITLHLVQTHLWYDGLAQDVSIWSSQGSVIIMLVLILLMENQRRGLFWGKKVGFLKRAGRVARKYHGYVIAWGLVYTLWYHPMVPPAAHLTGFLYMFLLLMQGSLFFTRLHVTPWWMAILEVGVLFHGTIVAIGQANGLWPMFFFGFAGIFVITQMHGLKWPDWAKWATLAAYILVALGVYSQLGWGRLNEIIRIPIIEYVLVFVFAGVIALGLEITRRISPERI